MRLTDLPEHVEHWRMRVLQDALNHGMAETYRRAAERLEAARPRPGDFVGRASRDELAESWRRLTEQAEACRHHASLMLAHEGIDADVIAALREVA